MTIRPKLAGGLRGLPHEFPVDEHQAGTNDKHALREIGKVQRLIHRGVLTLERVLEVDPPDPRPHGTGIVYLFDDGGGTTELRVKYNQDGSILTGAVTLA